MTLAELGIISAIMIAWGGVIAAILRGMLSAQIASAVEQERKSLNEDVIEPMREQLQRIERSTVRTETWLELNKAALAGYGGARHDSPFGVNTEWLAGLIESSRYVPDEVMLAEFRRIVADPEIPADDATLWNVIEARFGAAALAQEAMKFGAPGEAAPAIWILCVRKAQEIGADALMREIGVVKDR